MNEREIEIAYEESPAQELEGLRGVINELRRTNKVLIKEIEEYEDRIDKVVEILKLCNTKCSKEVIQILLGEK